MQGTILGVTPIHAAFLLYCRQLNADFTRSATLGRQALYMEKRDMEAVLRRFDVPYDKNKLKDIFATTRSTEFKFNFSEPFFEILGAKSVTSIDASEYEGATIIHDMNKPAPEHLHNKFSVLFDGGTLEHIFNFPVAIENCMKMLETGGHFISVAPANNFFGHGFYQFSSELFYRIFTEENGFRIDKVFLGGEKSNLTWYEIPDPAVTRSRVEFSNQIPTFQLFIAKKIDANAGLHVLPQQSDYHDILWEGVTDADWSAHGDPRDRQRLSRERRISEMLPRPVADYIRHARQLVRGAISPPFPHASLKKFKV
eukprot:gene16593-16774_t